jgi:hypothetical protein
MLIVVPTVKLILFELIHIGPNEGKGVRVV